MPPRVTVFELSNDTLREFFVGFCEGRVHDPAAVYGRRPPDVAHWGPGDKISGRIVEQGLEHAQARSFLDAYVESLKRTGWRVLRAAD